MPFFYMAKYMEDIESGNENTTELYAKLYTFEKNVQ